MDIQKRLEELEARVEKLEKLLDGGKKPVTKAEEVEYVEIPCRLLYYCNPDGSRVRTKKKDKPITTWHGRTPYADYKNDAENKEERICEWLIAITGGVWYYISSGEVSYENGEIKKYSSSYYLKGDMAYAFVSRIADTVVQMRKFADMIGFKYEKAWKGEQMALELRKAYGGKEYAIIDDKYIVGNKFIAKIVPIKENDYFNQSLEILKSSDISLDYNNEPFKENPDWTDAQLVKEMKKYVANLKQKDR